MYYLQPVEKEFWQNSTQKATNQKVAFTVFLFFKFEIFLFFYFFFFTSVGSSKKVPLCNLRVLFYFVFVFLCND